MKRHSDRDVTEFLPDALSIRHERPPFWASSTVLWMFLFFLLALGWATVGKVDIIVGASGRLVSDHPTIVMKPLERTVIKKVHVAVGDRVRAGDVLVTFDPAFTKADIERLASEVRIYEAQFERLSAEFEGREYTVEDDANTEAKWQYAIFLERKNFYQEKMNYFEKEIQRLEHSGRALADNIALQGGRVVKHKEIEGMVSSAIKAQAASKRSLREVELERMLVEVDISDKKNNLRVLESEKQVRMAERDSFKASWSIETSKEMVKTREQLIASRKEYDKAVQLASYVELCAPEDAVVHEVAPLSIGSAVREAETLVTLVPLGGWLEVEAEIKAEDIGKVHAGDPVRVKVTAFPFQKYGTLEGHVRVLSEDAFVRQTAGNTAAGTYYRARVELTGEESRGLLRKIIPGMETQCEIQVGERRIIEYLIHPIIKSLDESIREP
ncbi:MAG: HlyD family type I secretion periplasmic adaptor subunit [Clostridia bacterium]|nr:HlyD family type I secretion periplasmic adaptor subunit [Clostridia bacterium]